ncbi:MAG: ABC transporter substrate-binding protein, partial [Rhodocyclales bacterium CG17_big_fil_post_rev_8_21_14_2_50_68_7]
MKIAGKTLVAMGCAALFAAGVQAADPIRIGSVLSATGPGAFLGDPEVKTMRMYVDKINAEGGVLGRKIELVSYDDGTDANKANGFVKRLLADDKVDIIVGGTTTGSTMAMAPEVEKAGVPFISLAGAAVIIEPVKKWVFKTPHTDRMAVEKVFEDMKKRGFTKVALLVETSAFGQGGGKEARAHAAKYGLTLVAQESYGPKDTEMTPQL